MPQPDEALAEDVDEMADLLKSPTLQRVAKRLRELAADAERLDWLDRQRGDVTGEDQYGELELRGHGWGVYGQCLDVRTAIDAARATVPGEAGANTSAV